MKHQFGLIMAGIGVLSPFLNAVPQIVSALAAISATVYYSILIYDRLKKGPKNDV